MGMSKKIIAALLLAVSFSSFAKADVVEPGEIHRQFMFTNADKFAGYNFFYIYQGYNYDRGYHAGIPDTIVLENNKRNFTCTHGNNKSPLLAKDKKGNWYVSAITFGGYSKVSPSITGVVDVYTIISIKNGVIKIKKVKEITQYENGKEKEKKAGTGFAAFVNGDGFTKGLAITSAIALLALLFLFIYSRKPRFVHMAT